MESPKDVKAEEKPEETLETETSSPEASAGEPETDLEEGLEAPETPEKAEKLAEAEDLTEEERKNLSVKAQKRFTDLSKKAKRADELKKEVEALRQKQAEGFTAGLDKPEPVATPEVPPGLPWEADIEAGKSVDISAEDYKRDVVTTADSLVRARIQQARALDAKAIEVQSDLRALQATHSELDPESDNYDEELSTKLAGLFGEQLKANPNAKLSEFAGTVMSLRQGGEEKGKDAATAKLAAQKSEEALTPSTAEIEDVSKPFEEMNLQEQEKYLRDNGLWE